MANEWTFVIMTALSIGATYILVCRFSKSSFPVSELLTLVLFCAETVMLVQVSAFTGLLSHVPAFIIFCDAYVTLKALTAFVVWKKSGTSFLLNSVGALVPILAVICLLRMITYNTPPIAQDGLTYHLSFAVEWLQHGTFINPYQAYGDMLPVFYPLNGSMLYLWALAHTGSDFWARFAQVPFLIVIFLANLLIVQRLGGRFRASVLSLVLLFSIRFLRNAFHDQGNDLMLAGFLISAAGFLLEWLVGINGIVLLGFILSFSLAVGTKYLAIPYGIPLICLFVFQLARMKMVPLQKAKILGSVCVLLALSCLVISGYWYIRNAHVTGSAVYPESFGLPGLRSTMTPPVLAGHPFQHRCGSLATLCAELGNSILLIVPLALVAVVRSRQTPLGRGAWMLIAISVTTIVFFCLAIPYRHCRFLIFPLLILVPLASCSLDSLIPDRILPADPDLRKVGRFAFYAALIIAGLMPLKAEDFRLHRYDRWANRKIAGMSYGKGWAFLNQRSTKNAGIKIAMTATQNVTYPLYGDAFQNSVFFVPSSGIGQDMYYRWETTDIEPFRRVRKGNWFAALSKLSPDYLFSTVGMTSKLFSIEDEWARSRPGCFKSVYEDPQVRVYLWNRDCKIVH